LFGPTRRDTIDPKGISDSGLWNMGHETARPGLPELGRFHAKFSGTWFRFRQVLANLASF
jgi:hypothetical protein